MDNRPNFFGGMTFRLLALAIRYRTPLLLPFFVHDLISQVNDFSYVLPSIFCSNYDFFFLPSPLSSSFSGCEMGSLRKSERFHKRSHQGEEGRTLLVYEGKKAS
uniref:Uncharacterized protein n=1 Tax=Populus davidiana TaxID=266767 RepID=A0A6M2ETS4_9ROSI